MTQKPRRTFTDEQKAEAVRIVGQSGTCSRRTFSNQASELFLACAALNRMTHLSMPDSYVLNP